MSLNNCLLLNYGLLSRMLVTLSKFQDWIVDIGVHSLMFVRLTLLVLEQANDVADGVVVHFVVGGQVPKRKLMVQMVIQNINAILVLEFHVFLAEFSLVVNLTYHLLHHILLLLTLLAFNFLGNL